MVPVLPMCFSSLFVYPGIFVVSTLEAARLRDKMGLNGNHFFSSSVLLAVLPPKLFRFFPFPFFHLGPRFHSKYDGTFSRSVRSGLQFSGERTSPSFFLRCAQLSGQKLLFPCRCLLVSFFLFLIRFRFLTPRCTTPNPCAFSESPFYIP